MITADAVRSAGVARAWQLGHRLADLLTTHDVPRPARITTTVWRTGRIAGFVTVDAELTSPADLFRLARGTGAEIETCIGAGVDREQAYINLTPLPSQLQVYWAGPVSS